MAPNTTRGCLDRRNAPKNFSRSSRGGVAVEFAIIGPILLLLLLGIMVYGGYFLMAHSLQQLANDAARAAVAGLSDTERQELASASLDPKLVQLGYSDQSQVMTVNIAYDASSSPLWALNGVIPMPSPSILRSAAVQVGGY